jgi:hypothetical protein
MINVHAHPERMILRQHRAKLGVIRCGRKIGTRVPMRRNSMCGIARKRLSKFSSLPSLKEERVASRKKHVADFGMLLQIAKGFFEISVQFLFPTPLTTRLRVQ